MGNELLSLLSNSKQSQDAPKERVLLAMLLRYLLDEMDDKDKEPGEGTLPPDMEAFREPGIRVRPDWMPSGG
jgi:hypothetical protein